MNYGKILGLAALGVGAVAAAPFTGGGSILGAATLAGSLAGASTIAAAVGAGAAGAAAGYAMSRKEEEQENSRRNSEKSNKDEVAELKKELEKIKKMLEVFKSDNEYFSFIIAATAVGLAAANADGNISEVESTDIKEFIGGIGNTHYPQHVKDLLQDLEKNIPSIDTLTEYLEIIPPESLKSLEELVETVIWSDGIEHESEIKFRIAFQEVVKNIIYKKDENENNESTFLQEAKDNIEYMLNLPEVA
ncbi:TerB family tellurite resistance protein [Arcobacter ellisii]|uniref:Tellurite resistance TerB family protein n=1 Tax=Arcobacter ellisii TaxID=913109 RepID=A0A347UA42_9BACT|nr:TerB family tellurite resistance protein [Arcobacter ellisii]AXX95720.1 hypothetical protein AELL_2078 [Arcobacter ellisii]RXI31406.1 hypothetical protein CP962_04645 [Arcobacter ellisii]